MIYKKEKIIMTDIIMMVLIIGMPVAAFLYTIVQDKRNGANGW